MSVFFTDIPCRSKDPYLNQQEEVNLYIPDTVLWGHLATSYHTVRQTIKRLFLLFFRDLLLVNPY